MAVDSQGRLEAARYYRPVFRIDGINGGTDIKEISCRTKLFGGDKEQLLQVIVNVGTFYSLTVPAERRGEVDACIAELEQARDRASS